LKRFLFEEFEKKFKRKSKLMVCPPHILTQLQNRGIVPINVTAMEGSAHHYGNCTRRDENGYVREWEEPIYGMQNASEYKGFDLPHNTRICDHTGHMSEVVACDGVLWKLTRVIHSQPYCSAEECEKSIEKLQQFHHVRLTVTDDALSWYSNHSRLCIMVRNDPILFRDFRRSFRYWLILHTKIGRFGHCRMHDNFFPDGMEPPHFLFFDIIECADFHSVRLGFDPSVKFTSAIFEEYTTQETLDYMKKKHKQWCWERCGVRPSWILPLLVTRYIGHLRFMIALKASYAPVKDPIDGRLRPPKRFRDSFEVDFGSLRG